MNERENVISGYKIVMEKLQELEDDGYTIRKVASSSVENAETMDKYDGESNLPFDLWTHVGIRIDDDHGIDRIFDLGEELYKLGISFDTGFGGEIGRASCRERV